MHAMLPPSDACLARAATTHAATHFDRYCERLVSAGFTLAGGYGHAEELSGADRAKLERDAARGLVTEALLAARIVHGEGLRSPSACDTTTALLHALLMFADEAQEAIEEQGTAMHGGREGFRPWTADDLACGASDYAERLGAA